MTKINYNSRSALALASTLGLSACVSPSEYETKQGPTINVAANWSDVQEYGAKQGYSLPLINIGGEFKEVSKTRATLDALIADAGDWQNTQKKFRCEKGVPKVYFVKDGDTICAIPLCNYTSKPYVFASADNGTTSKSLEGPKRGADVNRDGRGQIK